MSDLAGAFTRLDSTAKATFLARVAHMATTAARESYIPDAAHPNRDYDHPDPIILRDANNFVHRVTGYIMVVLEGKEGAGQDESVIAMIEEYFWERRLYQWLPQWLGISLERAP